MANRKEIFFCLCFAWDGAAISVLFVTVASPLDPDVPSAGGSFPVPHGVNYILSVTKTGPSLHTGSRFDP